jgi:hypothetical protein
VESCESLTTVTSIRRINPGLKHRGNSFKPMRSSPDAPGPRVSEGETLNANKLARVADSFALNELPRRFSPGYVGR